MIITPGLLQEIHNSVTKTLQRILIEKREQLALLDIIDIKDFTLDWHPPQENVSSRPEAH